MSIARMTALGIERQSEEELRTRADASGAGKPAAAGRADEPKKAVESAMEKISAFIPSEVIGIYVAGFGILSPESPAGKWWIFGICLALIPILIWLDYLLEKKKRSSKLTFRVASILLVLAMVGFVAWAAALPGTPFLSITPRATAIGGWSVVILAVVMYRIADLLDVVPKRR